MNELSFGETTNGGLNPWLKFLLAYPKGDAVAVDALKEATLGLKSRTSDALLPFGKIGTSYVNLSCG